MTTSNTFWFGRNFCLLSRSVIQGFAGHLSRWKRQINEATPTHPSLQQDDEKETLVVSCTLLLLVNFDRCSQSIDYTWWFEKNNGKALYLTRYYKRFFFVNFLWCWLSGRGLIDLSCSPRQVTCKTLYLWSNIRHDSRRVVWPHPYKATWLPFMRSSERRSDSLASSCTRVSLPTVVTIYCPAYRLPPSSYYSGTEPRHVAVGIYVSWWVLWALMLLL